jgi:phage tail-like protein
MPVTTEPYSAHRYWIEIKGLQEASFSECSGLQSELEVEEWKAGGLNDYVHRLPGRVKAFQNLVLKRGLASPDLWDWYYRTSQGKPGTIKREHISIVLYGLEGQPGIRWNVIDALPVKWGGPTLKSSSGEVAFETIEFIHHGFERAS